MAPSGSEHEGKCLLLKVVSVIEFVAKVLVYHRQEAQAFSWNIENKQLQRLARSLKNLKAILKNMQKRSSKNITHVCAFEFTYILLPR